MDVVVLAAIAVLGVGVNEVLREVRRVRAALERVELEVRSLDVAVASLGVNSQPSYPTMSTSGREVYRTAHAPSPPDSCTASLPYSTTPSLPYCTAPQCNQPPRGATEPKASEQVFSEETTNHGEPTYLRRRRLR